MKKVTQKKILAAVITVAVVLALVLLVGEKSPEATWGRFWLLKGISALVLVLGGNWISKNCNINA